MTAPRRAGPRRSPADRSAAVASQGSPPAPEREQLTLHLESPAPRLSSDAPLALRPMLARTRDDAFDSPDHDFEPRWGGLRVLALVEAGRVRLVDRHGRELGHAFPELAGRTGLAERVEGLPVALDTELVVPDSTGRHDSGALGRRLDGLPGADAVLLVFDLLVLEGRPLLAVPLERRRLLLRRSLHQGGTVLLVPATPGEGIALHGAVAEQGLDGTMARHRRSPYLPGVRSALWQFIAVRTAPGSAALQRSPTGALPAREPDASVAAGSPVLAILSRLPLGDEDGRPG